MGPQDSTPERERNKYQPSSLPGGLFNRGVTTRGRGEFSIFHNRVDRAYALDSPHHLVATSQWNSTRLAVLRCCSVILALRCQILRLHPVEPPASATRVVDWGGFADVGTVSGVVCGVVGGEVCEVEEVDVLGVVAEGLGDF